MRKTFWDKRIPSLLGILFLAISVGMVSWFGKNYTELRSKASTGGTPKNVQISNITDTSFTVSYTTDEKTIGTIAYGKDQNLGQVGLDDRDKQEGKTNAYQVHFVTLSNLDPHTKYYFAIQSGATAFLNVNQPYETTTASSLTESLPNHPAVAGTVVLPDGSIPNEGIVSISTDNSQVVSTLLKADGTYLLPVTSLRTKDLTTYFPFDSNTIFHMTVLNASAQSLVSVLALHTNPVPLITLSKDYDFTTNTSLSFSNFTATESGTASQSGTLSPAPTFGFPLLSTQTASGPAILTPKTDAKFTDQQPLFQGTAIPEATVKITIESTQEIQTSIQADNFGNWQFRPSAPLAPGQHTITIVSKDANGILQSIKRSFTVYAEGSQFTEPSVSPTIPAPTVTVAATPTVTPSPTVVPTATPILSPTIISPSTSLSPTVAISTTPSPTSPPLPRSGNSTLFVAGFVALLSIAAGFMLFFF